MTPPSKPPTPPSTVFFGLTWGASLCFPQAMPAKRAKVSLPKEMARGSHTLVPEGTVRVFDRHEQLRELTDEQLVAAGIEPGMVRVSVGLENVEDIIADLQQALEQI